MTVKKKLEKILIKKGDFLEKIIIIFIFSILMYRMIFSFFAENNYISLFYLMDQFFVLLFTLFRRPAKSFSSNFYVVFLGFAGTLAPLFIIPPNIENGIIPIPLAIIFLLIGFATHFSAKLILRRSFGVVAANRGVKITGIYRFVRHPMYLGYIISLSAILLAGFNINNIFVFFIACIFFILRIRAEEKILAQDESYQAYCLVVHWRLIPKIF
jgi:protein-S-isoprenylcysteine O-methyltransferase Ste14